MKIRRTMQWLALGLVVPLLGGATEVATPDAAGSSAAGCTITVKAFLKRGAFGNDYVGIGLGNDSRVRIKGGTWSRLGNDRDRWVRFNSDGTWEEPGRHGTGEWSGQFQLNMGCRYNRRYEFRIDRGYGAEVHPQYPSASTWTRSQTIDLGNLAQYF